MMDREQTQSSANQWAAAPVGVACAQCSRDFVLAVREESWVDRLLGRFRVIPFRCQVCRARFRKRLAAPLPRQEMGRRQYLRLPIQLPCILQLHNGTTSSAMVKDISIGGCEIMGDKTPERGTTVTIQMSGLILSGTIDAEAISVHKSNPESAGMKFIGLSGLGQEELGRFIYMTWKSGKAAVGGKVLSSEC
jgi:PilZ domain